MARKQLGAAPSGQSDAARLADVVISAAFAQVGTLVTKTGTLRWYNDTGRTLTFGTIRASVGTAPTGATVVVDVRVDGTSIWNVTTGNRPAIAISGNTATGSAPDTTTVASGHYLTVDIVQVGSTVAGADLTVQVNMS